VHSFTEGPGDVTLSSDELGSHGYWDAFAVANGQFLSPQAEACRGSWLLTLAPEAAPAPGELISPLDAGTGRAWIVERTIQVAQAQFCDGTFAVAGSLSLARRNSTCGLSRTSSPRRRCSTLCWTVSAYPNYLWTMWTEKGEVDRAIEELQLTERLLTCTTEEAKRLYRELERRFSVRPGAKWIWEHFRFPGTSQHSDDDRAFERLSLVVPSTSEELMFFPGSDQDAVCAYRGTIGAITNVIAECPSFEYCITPRGLEWLICENHHGVLMALGEPVESRLRAL
jgi:hypothetical protein